MQTLALTNNTAVSDGDMVVPGKSNEEPEYYEITDDDNGINDSKVDPRTSHYETDQLHNDCQAENSVSIV